MSTEVIIGIIIVFVFVAFGWQQLRERKPASDNSKSEAEILINDWARARGYFIEHKSFIEREIGTEKRLYYDIMIRDAENNQRAGMVICVFPTDNPERARVDVVWKTGPD